jgi:hypothetical protein
MRRQDLEENAQMLNFDVRFMNTKSMKLTNTLETARNAWLRPRWLSVDGEIKPLLCLQSRDENHLSYRWRYYFSGVLSRAGALLNTVVTNHRFYLTLDSVIADLLEHGASA